MKKVEKIVTKRENAHTEQFSFSRKVCKESSAAETPESVYIRKRVNGVKGLERVLYGKRVKGNNSGKSITIQISNMPKIIHREIGTRPTSNF